MRIGQNVNVQIDDADAPQTAASSLKKLPGSGLRQLQGTISTIEPASGGGNDAGSEAKQVTVDIAGSGLSPGLKASAYIAQESGSPGLKIPASALHSDDGGEYVFTVADHEGPLGSAYYAEKAYVTAGERNDDTVVVLNGLAPDERIVTEASAPLGDGDRVRLE